MPFKWELTNWPTINHFKAKYKLLFCPPQKKGHVDFDLCITPVAFIRTCFTGDVIVERATARFTEATAGALLNAASFLLVSYVLHTTSMGQTRVSVDGLERLFRAGSLCNEFILCRGHKVQS